MADSIIYAINRLRQYSILSRQPTETSPRRFILRGENDSGAPVHDSENHERTAVHQKLKHTNRFQILFYIAPYNDNT